MRYSRIFITGGSGFIGTNLIESLTERGSVRILNADIAPPKIKSHHAFWKEIDIRDAASMASEFEVFQPDLVIHLAARTDLDGKTLDDYTTNTDGTQVVVELVARAGRSISAIFTSSMYVCRPGYQPLGPDDYQSHTIYGESKVVGEKIVKESGLETPWAIVRPTSIWGPWFGVPYIDFFRIVLKKRFMHIGCIDTHKTYGYVGNTVAQIMAVAERIESVVGKVIYLGDSPAYSISEWADEISEKISYKIPKVPKVVFSILAIIGDGLSMFGVNFPMTSFRLSNMTTDNVHDLSIVEGLLPVLPYSRAEGTEHTYIWMRDHDNSV